MSKVNDSAKDQKPSAAHYDDTLIAWKDLEPWMKDNEFIITGYRKVSHSIERSARSIFKIHNETGNIWTHLLGAGIFISSLVTFYFSSLPTLSSADMYDRLAVSIYYVGVVNCFVLSTVFHTFSNHSREGHKLGNELDHLGVVMVIWGSAMPCSYFAFRDESKELRYMHYALNCGFALASAIFTLRPKFRQPEYRRVRFYMYVLLGVSAFLPVAQGLQMYGFEELDRRMSLRYFLGLGLLNFTGAAIYTARVPERWYPVQFDIWGSSHQIMHVLVFCGALSHERGLMKAIQYWGERGQ